MIVLVGVSAVPRTAPAQALCSATVRLGRQTGERERELLGRKHVQTNQVKKKYSLNTLYMLWANSVLKSFEGFYIFVSEKL